MSVVGVTNTGPLRLLRPPRPGPCLNFGLQLTLSQPGGRLCPPQYYGPCLAQIRRGAPVCNTWMVPNANH